MTKAPTGSVPSFASTALHSPTVLFIAPSAYLLGGVADWLDYLLPGLEERGWTCTLGLTEGALHSVEAYSARHPWHRVVRLASPTGSHQGRIEAIQFAIAKVRPDVVAVVNLVDAYDAIADMRVRSSVVQHCPRVAMTLHGLQSDLLGDVSRYKSTIDCVIVTNRLTQAIAIAANEQPDRVLYAPYGVATDGVASTFSRDQFAVPGAQSQTWLLYAGRLENGQKRIRDLPEILASARGRGFDVYLSIAGSGPEESVLREDFARLRLSAFVRWLGVLDNEALSAAYRAHDALIITSAWETGPIVAWEAMSNGLPVVSSRYVGCGLEAALKSGENCMLFPVGEVNFAVDALLALRSGELRTKIIAGGHELVRHRYSQTASIDAWLTALSNVLRLPALPSTANPLRKSSDGRLGKVLSPRLAERVRRALRVSFQHSDAGGEWPHTASAVGDELDFLARIRELDEERAT